MQRSALSEQHRLSWYSPFSCISNTFWSHRVHVFRLLEQHKKRKIHTLFSTQPKQSLDRMYVNVRKKTELVWHAVSDDSRSFPVSPSMHSVHVRNHLDFLWTTSIWLESPAHNTFPYAFRYTLIRLEAIPSLLCDLLIGRFTLCSPSAQVYDVAYCIDDGLVAELPST